MTALILFTRELAKELRSAADQWEAESGPGSVASTGFTLRLVAGAIEAAAKRAFRL